MSGKIDPKFLVTAVMLAAAATLLLAFGRSGRGEDAADELKAPPLFAAEARCKLAGEQARARAIESERAARARWERVPYDASEGTQAVLQLEEALHCFRVAGDREARARAEANLTVWKRELERLYARTQLNLTLALRADDIEAAADEAKVLVALLSKAGAPADPYRSFLKGVERKARALSIERLRASEEN